MHISYMRGLLLLAVWPISQTSIKDETVILYVCILVYITIEVIFHELSNINS